MKSRKLFTVFLLSICMILFVHSEENLSISSSESVRPAVAVNQNGTILVVWCENSLQGSESGDIYYNVNENDLWSGPQSAGLTKYETSTPNLDVDSNGNFHLSYADGDTGANRDIYHAVYTPGEGWSTPSMIWLSNTNSAWNKIDIENDMIYIVWHHKNGGKYVGSDIVMQYKNVASTSWPSSYERISWNAFETSIYPSFKVKNERVYCSYMQGSPIGEPWQLYYKEGDRGISWRDFQETQLAPSAFYPEIEVDDEGSVHIVWSADDGNFYYRKKTGTTWGTAEIISDKNTPSQWGEMRYRNPVFAAALIQTENNVDTLFYALKKINEEWDLPVQVAPGNGKAGQPRVWIGGDFLMHVVWEDGGGIGSNREVWYEKFQVLHPIKAPSNFVGQVLENRALFYREYLHQLTWEANVENQNIVKYKLYEIDGRNRLLVEEFDANTFAYLRRFVSPDKTYTYELVAVDDKDFVGEAATLIIQ